MSQESRQKWLNCEDEQSKAFLERNSKEEICKLLHKSILEWAETDTFVREKASKVLDDFQINGDSYGVPGIECIVELLVKEIIELRNELEEIKDRDWHDGAERDLLT